MPDSSCNIYSSKQTQHINVISSISFYLQFQSKQKGCQCSPGRTYHDLYQFQLQIMVSLDLTTKIFVTLINTTNE